MAWNGSAWAPVQMFRAVPGDTYEVVLQYKDVFDNLFRTVHPRGLMTDAVAEATVIHDKMQQRRMMARPNRPMPVFLAGEQTWSDPPPTQSLA